MYRITTEGTNDYHFQTMNLDTVNPPLPSPFANRPAKIRDLLTDKSKWTQNLYSRDAAGNSVMPSDYLKRTPVSFCLRGAAYWCYGEGERYNAIDQRLRDEMARRGFSLTKWNDHPQRTFEEVRALVEELDI